MSGRTGGLVTSRPSSWHNRRVVPLFSPLTNRKRSRAGAGCAYACVCVWVNYWPYLFVYLRTTIVKLRLFFLTIEYITIYIIYTYTFNARESYTFPDAEKNYDERTRFSWSHGLPFGEWESVSADIPLLHAALATFIEILATAQNIARSNNSDRPISAISSTIATACHYDYRERFLDRHLCIPM